MKKLISELTIQNKKSFLGLLGMAIILAIFSFPEVDLSYTIGIDPPLKWLFNHIFSEGFSMGKGIIFPHGPLAFFMYPLENTFIFTAILTAVLQIVFVIQLFSLLQTNKKTNWLITAVLAFIIFSVSNLNQLILSNISISFLLYFRNGKSINKYWGFILAALAFYVKAYVAILSGTFVFSLLVIEFVQKKDYKKTLTDIAVVLGAMLILWLIMYGTLSGFINYCIGMMNLAGDNSAAAAFHPKNNWWFLLPFLLVVFVLPFIQKTKEGKLFGFLFFLSFFASWKYGMAREDYSHVRTYLIFSAVSLVLFVFYHKKNLKFNIPAVIIAIAFLFLNMKNVENYQAFSVNYAGIGNFTKFISSYSEIKEQSKIQNEKNIASNKLPSEIRNKIGNAKVDVYPWDYTIVKANNFNWQPRPVIQSYAAYTSTLDGKNAAHFRSEKAPEYLIFDLNKITFNLNGDKLESIDNRYLLNDEPQTILEIIQNYATVFSDEDFIVYKKNKKTNTLNSVITKTETAQWNKWIEIPDSASSFTRMKVHTSNSFSGKLKSAVYKDELYYIYLRNKNGSIFQYRFVPKNATDGLWIAPFFNNLSDRSPAEEIKEIMLSCSNKNRVKNPFLFEWEYFETDSTFIHQFFAKTETQQAELLLKEGFDFETENKNWEGFNSKKVINYSYYKQKAYRIDPEIFSPAFTFNTDSLKQLPARIKVECLLKTYSGAEANVVIETKTQSGEKNWNGIEINKQIININEINLISNYLNLTTPNTEVKVYIWNNGKKSIMVYGLNVSVTALN